MSLAPAPHAAAHTHWPAVLAASGQWASARWVTAGAAALGVVLVLGLAAWRAEVRLSPSPPVCL